MTPEEFDAILSVRLTDPNEELPEPAEGEPAPEPTEIAKKRYTVDVSGEDDPRAAVTAHATCSLNMTIKEGTAYIVVPATATYDHPNAVEVS